MAKLASYCHGDWTRVDGPRSWIVNGACAIAMTLIMGVIYSSSIYYVVFLEEFQEGRGKTALTASLQYGALFVIGPFAGALGKRYGHRMMAIIGGFVAGFGLVLSSLATSVNYLVLSYGILVGSGIGVSSITAMAIIVDHFDKWTGLAFGFVCVGTGIGNLIYPFIIEGLIHKYGWRGSLILLGGITLNLCVCGAMMFPMKKLANETTTKSQEIEVGKLSSKFTTSRQLLQGPFILFCLASLIVSFGISVYFTHIGAFATIDLRMDGGQLSMVISVVGITGLIGRLLQGFIMSMPCVEVHIVVILLFLCMGIVIAVVPVINTYRDMLVMASLFGAFQSGYGPALAEAAKNHVGMEHYAVGYGLQQLFCGVGYILGAPAAGWLFDALQVYAPSFYLAGSVVELGVLFFIVVFLWKKSVDSKKNENNLVPITHIIDSSGEREGLM